MRMVALVLLLSGEGGALTEEGKSDVRHHVILRE
jgi:hypothetical protein